MATNLSDLDKYLQGIPLSAENAALQEGRDLDAETVATVAKIKYGTQEKFTEEEMEWVRRLKYEPGFPILMRLINSAIQKREDAAKLLSSTDPLNNQDSIIREWTYIASFRQIVNYIESLPS